MFDVRNPTVFPDRIRLAAAGILSLLFHAAILGAGAWVRPDRHEPPPAALRATLLPPLAVAAPELITPDAPPPATVARPAPEPTPPPAPSRPGFTAVDAARMALRQMAERPFYPEEAIARGLEGEALVRLFLDEAGNAIAARLERSSGHALLDDAAIRAARAVRSLPAGAPDEVLLPIRFRLR